MAEVCVIDLNGHFVCAVACRGATLPPTPTPGWSGGAGDPTAAAEWACASCTFINSAGSPPSLGCQMCGTIGEQQPQHQPTEGAESTAAAAAMQVDHQEEAKYFGKCLVLFNTSSANYLTGSGGLISSFAFDTFFAPPATPPMMPPTH